ncbi:MAG: hypothetical protein QM736_20105 [Vicinamibacterales bacterium]
MPLAALAGILLDGRVPDGVVSMSRSCSSCRRPTSPIRLVTFALTVLADLTVAVETGMILAMLMFHPQGLANDERQRRRGRRCGRRAAARATHKQVPDYVTVYRVYGPLLFGATDSQRITITCTRCRRS